MRCMFFVIAVFAFSYAAESQITKGNWLVSGSGSLYAYHEDAVFQNAGWSAKYTAIDLSASVGYFLVNKFSAGLRPQLSILKGSSSNGGVSNNVQFAVGPFVRYYLLKQDRIFNVLLDGSYQLGLNQERHGEKPKGRFNTLSIMTGIEVFLNSSVGLEMLIGYKNQLTSYDNTASAFSINRNGLQTSIGFNFHLEKQ